MRRIALLIVVVLLPALWFARGGFGRGGAASPATPPALGEGAVPAVQTFLAADVYLDVGTKHLAAYQLEVTAPGASIVGLEGGESTAFQSAPYYDPEALQGHRIIVAAFSTEDARNLPTGSTRVARLHLLAGGDVDPVTKLPAMTTRLVVVTDESGTSVNATLQLRPFQGETR